MNTNMSDNKQTTDSELLLQVVGYNQSAFEQLYSRYSATIYSLIKETVSNPKLAEKILLNVFSIFLKRMEYYSTTSNNIFTWLTLLSRNISLDVLKRMKFVEDIPIYSDEYEIEFILPNLSTEISAINFSERTLLGEKFKSYKSQLTEVQNLVLSLVYFEGLSEEEIAKRLNVSNDAVRQRVLSIMETLYQMHFGKQESNSNKEIINLIRLEPLGYLSPQERMLFNQIRENDPDFLWEKLGEYQNLVALLSTTIPIEEPPHQLTAEINSLFVNILQGSEVEYPIITPEPPILKQMPEPLPEVIKLPEIQEKKEKEFQIKFKEQNSNVLNELRSQQTLAVPQTPKPEPVNVKKEIVIRDQNVVVKKQILVNDNIENAPKINSFIKPQEQINTKTENIIENKATTIVAKPEINVENKTPLVAVEEPKTLMVKDNGVIKNKLTPTSSINLKDFFKNNDPIKSTNQLDSSADKDVNKSIPSINQKPEIKIKSTEVPTELNKTNVIIQKEEKATPERPASTVIEQSGIKIRSNEPPKEIRRPAMPIETKVENKVTEKVILPKSDKPDIVIKSNEPPKEFRRSNQVFAKNETITQSKPASQVVEKQELKTVTAPVDSKVINKTVVAESKPSDLEKKTVSGKYEVKVQPNVKTQESPKVLTDVKEVKPVEDKKAVDAINIEIADNKILENQKLAEEVKLSEKKTEKAFERISPSVDRTTLKIRETKFVDKEIKPNELKPQQNFIAKETIEEKVKINSSASLEDLNIDEILNKIEDEKPTQKKNDLISENSYEEEVVRLRKKLKRNILVSAALFAILIASGIFTYLQMNQPTSTQVSNKVSKLNKDIINNEPLSVVPTSDSVVINSPNEITEIVNEPLKQEENSDVRVSLQPITENITKDDSKYFTLQNENNQLSGTKDTKQIAAAKTENIVPPKENKVKEEEPAFFVAVEEMPELIGGIKGLQSKITYPKIAAQTNTEGKVLVQAVVDENGKVISTNVIKGIGAGCDEVALDAVLNSKFKPGKQRGKNVKVQVTIPIVFKK